MKTKILVVLLVAFCSWLPSSQSAPPYDVVLLNGRVIDPESKLDAVRHVGIRGNQIAAISAKPLTGKTTIDAQGLVIAPGFIDLHSHGQDDENYRYKAMDGVTTALEMEVGASPVAKWYGEREGKALINFGATVGHIPARMRALKDTGSWLPRDAAMKTASAAQRAEVQQYIREGLKEGALGIGFGINYVPGATRDEVFEIFRIAAELKVPCYVHLRFFGAIEPGSALEGLQEVLSNAAASGAALHVVHITSTCLRDTSKCLAMIEGARQRGMDVTTEAYPYTAGMTGLETAIFDEGWREKLGISYGDLQWVATGERLNEESFKRYRTLGGLVVIHSIPEDISRLAAANPLVIVASDGLLTAGKGHPRGAGSYARVLGRYVREQKLLSLPDAIRKMTLLPAQRLEASVPMMRRKGRVKVGADADLVLFDAATVNDQATFDNPAQYSQGIQHVLVNGAFVVRDSKLIENTKPGLAIRR